MWSNGKGMIPDHDFCAPADITNDVEVIKGCIVQKTETACNGQCKWRRGKQAATDVPKDDAINNEADITGPFFSKRFCHPISTKSFEQDAEMCLVNKDAQSCPTALCAWTSAKELIPANDFCAPAEMTLEKDIIMGCTDNNDESTCLGKCQWYKGTVVETNSTDPTTEPTGWCKWSPPANTTNISAATDPCYNT
jgi:hypothetical protein